jgi:hypothetical protein
MPAMKPGWNGRPTGYAPGAKISNGDIWRAVKRLGESESGFSVFAFVWPVQKSTPIGAPPVLQPIRKAHAARWLNELFKPMTHERAEAEEFVERLFSGPSARKYGVTLKDFAAAARPLFGQRDDA